MSVYVNRNRTLWSGMLFRLPALFLLFSNYVYSQVAQPQNRIGRMITHRFAHAPLQMHRQSLKMKVAKPVVIDDPSRGGVPFFTHYGTEQGLALNNVICSATDRVGNIWLGTGGGGVSRFDGKRFTNYTTAQGLSANVVFAIREDRHGNLWFGTTAGVSKYDGRKFSNYSVNDGLAGNFVSCILLDKTGQLWFGTHENGVSRYDGKRFTNYNKESGLPANYIRCLLQDRNGKIWLGTDANGLIGYDGSHFTSDNAALGLAGQTVNCLAEDNMGRLWAGTNAGVSVFNGRQFTNYSRMQGLAADAVYAIAQDPTGILWLGTGNNGLSKFDNNVFTNYRNSLAIPPGKINSLTVDREGILWVASQGGGLNKWMGPGLTYFTRDQGLAGNLIFFITQDKRHRLWFATYESGASQFDGKRFTNYTASQGLGDNIIWGVLFDRAGNTWFATDRSGVTKFDGKHFTHYTTAEGLPGNSVVTMTEDNAGNLWFGTRGNGVSKFDGKHFANFSTAQGLPENNIQRIVQDKKGVIWLATHDDGISSFDGAHFRNYNTKQGLAGNHVSTLILDQAGHLWVGTDHGISEFDGRKFTNFTSSQGLADNTITEIVEDKKFHQIWFGTNKGLSVLQGGKFQNFNHSTGYPMDEVSTSGLFVDSMGVVWLGSGSGKLVRFDPSNSGHKKIAPAVLQVQAVRINNENVCWNCLLKKELGKTGPDSLTLLNEQETVFGKTLSPRILTSLNKRFSGISLDGVDRFYFVPSGLVLSNENNNISIDFAAITPASADIVKYQYELEGYSKDWSSLTNATTAVFANLSSGTYTFRVKALALSGGWIRAAYVFRVLPPWWLTWWAELLWVLAAAGTLYILYRSRISALESRQASQLRLMVATQEEERKRISLELHDDVGIKLSAMRLFLSSICEKSFGSGQEDIHQLAQNSEDLIGEVMQDVRQLLRDLSPALLEEFGYLTAVEGLVDKINETKMTRFELTTFGLEKRLQKEHELSLYRMTQELINNVLKHAGAGHASLIAGRRDGQLILMIEDDGMGFDSRIQKEGYGLHHLAARANLLGGNLHIDSTPGKGTSVSINIPYNPE